MLKNFAENVIAFNNSLKLDFELPPNIRAMNPFAESETARDISTKFYRKYYSDNKIRKLILGINPGRLGAGSTGVPFTDTKRLESVCDLPFKGKHTHEPSSVFVYEVVAAYGGAKKFYDDVYISSVCPLGFVVQDDKGREKNYNYYDSRELTEAVTPFVIQSIRKQLGFGIDTSVGYCMGTGKNFKYLEKLNKQEKFFERVVPLEHPRYVMQYKHKQIERYVDKYIDSLKAY